MVLSPYSVIHTRETRDFVFGPYILHGPLGSAILLYRILGTCQMDLLVHLYMDWIIRFVHRPCDAKSILAVHVREIHEFGLGPYIYMVRWYPVPHRIITKGLMDPVIHLLFIH